MELPLVEGESGLWMITEYLFFLQMQRTDSKQLINSGGYSINFHLKVSIFLLRKCEGDSENLSYIRVFNPQE